MDYRCLLLLALVESRMLDNCLKSNPKYTMNVVLLNDETLDWHLPFVREVVKEAIKEDEKLNIAAGLDTVLTANYKGFNTTLYKRGGCGSSTCEGVEILKSLHAHGDVGCVMLGPSCSFATFFMVDVEIGLTLTIPIISAGSFGLSCDYKTNLTRLLPPARKVSNFFVHFWNFTSRGLKTSWASAYVYKKEDQTEDCYWYINALEAQSVQFALTISREMLRNKKELKDALESQTRHSNISVLSSYDFRLLFNDYVAGYYDGVLLFGHMLRQRLLSNQQKASELSDENPFRNISFYGQGGHYVLDENGDRDVNFSVIYTSTVNNRYKTLFVFDTSLNETRVEDSTPSLTWPESKLPSDKPVNPSDLSTQDVIVIVLSISILVVTVIALMFYRQNMKERRNRKRWSHISPDLIGPLDGKELSLVSLKIDEDTRKDSCYQIHRGRYDKKPVILKELQHTDGNFSENQRIELNTLLHIDYYNLTKFYGTVKFDYGVFGVFEFCERGSLRYVLNDKISYPEESFMDLEFKISVMYDIAKGMSYLHSSNVQVHGRLKSSNCVVDNRMVVKITDFGCNTILSPSKDLWTAPEHLRKQGISQKGDVYSFAIISQEIIMRQNPFFTKACSDNAGNSLAAGVTGESSRTLFSHGQRHRLCILIKNCWEEDPEKRPDFKKIEGLLGKIFSNLHNQANETYMDNLIRRLQMYSRNLEHLVEERTALYKAERDRADRLNFMLLPAPVVRSLKETGRVEPELFEEVTVYFSDIVGFTTLCHYSTPMEVVDMLNDIYKNFDGILDHHDVYKVETIGDAYMVASGLPRRNGNWHAVDIARMALDILAFVGTFQLQHLPGIPLWIRIGVHSGPCAAGVVGNKMPRYCLFGDTVNTASRMESTALRIHVSQSTINILQRTDCKFEYERRGETFLKGKGKEMTYWLTGVAGTEYNLPTPPTAENFVRLQQDLSEMIISSLENREPGPEGLIRKTLSTRARRRDTSGSQGDGLPEYLHLAVTDVPNTYL
uniref:Guanylate cyclase n=1 Tax=Esox lucius TaxID=8010 RepID=A0A6Q2XZ32_ESOLU